MMLRISLRTRLDHGVERRFCLVDVLRLNGETTAQSREPPRRKELSMIERPLALPCGITLANRLCKSAMAEGLASHTRRATPVHRKLCAAGAEQR
jgi:hypothetical protein